MNVTQQIIIPEMLRDKLEQLWETENGCMVPFEEFVGMKLVELMGMN